MNQAFGADSIVEILALLLCANVAPNKRGADDFARSIQHDGAMHLAGEADASDLVPAQISLRQRFANGDARSAPPISGMLFRPADFRRGERLVFFGSGGDDAAVFVDDQRACAAGSDVDS